jgi:hypothetical protein
VRGASSTLIEDVAAAALGAQEMPSPRGLMAEPSYDGTQVQR